MAEYINVDTDPMIANLEKLPLFVRTLIYLASGASMLTNNCVMRQFAKTGTFSMPIPEEEMVS